MHTFRIKRRKNKCSKKINCECYFRLNFNENISQLEITKTELNKHTHPLNKTLYAQYSQTRKPEQSKMEEMVSAVKNGANLASVVRTHNNTS